MYILGLRSVLPISVSLFLYCEYTISHHSTLDAWQGEGQIAQRNGALAHGNLGGGEGPCPRKDHVEGTTSNIAAWHNYEDYLTAFYERRSQPRITRIKSGSRAKVLFSSQFNTIVIKDIKPSTKEKCSGRMTSPGPLVDGEGEHVRECVITSLLN